MADICQICNAAALAACEQLPPIITAGGSDADIMVMLETTIATGLLFNETVFHVERATTVERLEVLVERVMTRLAAHTAKGGLSHGRKRQ